MFINYKIDWRFVQLSIAVYILTVFAIWFIGFWLSIALMNPSPHRTLIATSLATSEAIVASPVYFVLILFTVFVPWYWRLLAKEAAERPELGGCK